MLRGGELIAGELHRERMLRTLRGQEAETSSAFLQRLLSTAPWREVEAYLMGQQILPATTYRLTLEYSLAGLSTIRLVPYYKRTICTLRPIPLPNGFDYSYKYADRSFFERVKAELASDEEPLFVRPDGTITDTSYTNVLIETEAGYLTPTRPLLKGTQREGLLRADLIAEADDLTLSTLRSKAKAILLINALLPLEEALRLPPEALQD
jgi:probable para-aminobenzoate synthase component I